MKKDILLILTLLLCAAPLSAFAKTNIFACEPEWGALAKEIGGDNVKIFTATTAHQDPHYVRAKPSLIAAMRKADLLICSGAGLEIGWLPLLLQKAGNRNVQPGQVGSIMAADYVPLLDTPQTVDRSLGDVHPEGNPHIHLNPQNVETIAKIIAERLTAIDGEDYSENLINFISRWQKAVATWQEKARPLAGKGYIPHHKNWRYLAGWLGLKEVVGLEPKPGLPPTTGHLEKVLRTIKKERPAFIIRSPYADSDAADWLAKKTDIPSLLLPYTVGGSEESTDLFKLYEQTINMLLEANHG
jgi:zinc/manganese transport system substrate-binding protein